MKLQTLTSLFGSRAFYREALAIALPVMFQQFIMSMVPLVDNFMISDLGEIVWLR
jgi:Na+-driven multidrug efflux pump